MSNKLPDKIIPISTLRIKRNKDKKCTCVRPTYEVDTVNKEISCSECGATVHPFDAMVDIATHYERLEKEVKNLLDQRRQILNWKPHLLAVRRLEEIYRGAMIPCCPHCGQGIMANEITTMTVNKKHELERRKFINNDDRERKEE